MNPFRLLGAFSSLVKHRHATYQFLRFCEDTDQAFAGSVLPNELDFLKTLVEEADVIPGPIIEVGTLFGFATQKMAEWKSESKELITIDNFRWNPIGLSSAAHKDFTRRILHYVTCKANTRIFEGDNSDFYRHYEGPTPSLIFIDAGHRYEDVIVDIEWAKTAGIPIIAGHDYADSFPGVMRAVDESFGDDKRLVGSVWVHSSTNA